MPPDYSGQNLRGRSFKGQNLEGANFSDADIRSADFSGAILKSANFSRANAGLQKRWATFLVVVSCLLMGLSLYLLAYNDFLIHYTIADWTIIIIILLISFFVAIRLQKIKSGFSIFLYFFYLFLLVHNPLAFAGGLVFIFAFIIAKIIVEDLVLVIVTFSGIVGGAIVIYECFFKTHPEKLFLPICLTLINIFTLRNILKRESQQYQSNEDLFNFIKNNAIAIVSIGSTSFRNANLFDTNFTEATLKNTDFINANLTHTCFHKIRKSNSVRPGTTYLRNALVHQVLVTGQGQDKKFDSLDLRGINFRNANLIDASFKGANLSGANLQDANLSRAVLVQTQLDGTDFTGATLTGACIEGWGITRDTKFDGVRCEYVYMRLPTRENPDPYRKPDNREEVFADGEFGDFIKPIIDTLDLYHNQGVDPRAIAISFKQLAENHPDAELEIVAMEKRGEDKFLLRAKTVPDADKSQLSQEYFEKYNQVKALRESEQQKLIAEKDSRIRSLENFVETALQRPSFYAETFCRNGSAPS